eukprot:CAMPEP_0201659744 /NCGR_PEP_ID=MMETSP0494-20130426/2515_1 /ASSEMBLY_ACC=CAM_ASM_000839 /TAXON_ID=420259 /ORGANISM="Thalassiosira gravida, Strain GMp14c1" /LENGTH=619 /DNA_ID=CAMNT_0048137365 /DNA_START=137 /DNA_END=1996 /DNA_ORIENTATION=+
MILLGFTYIFHELNSSAAFNGNENIIVGNNFVDDDGIRKRDRNRKKRVENNIYLPKQLHFFSDREAFDNAEKFHRLREWYSNNFRCICGRESDCHHDADQHSIVPEIPEFVLSAIQSTNGTKTTDRNTDVDTTNAKARMSQHQQKLGERSINLENEVIQLLDNDTFWNESNNNIGIKCPHVIMDLGSNRGDTLQSFLNVLLSSIHSPSSLSPFHDDVSHDHRGCNTPNNTTEEATEQQQQQQQQQLYYQFDLQSLSLQQRTAIESSKRYDRVHKQHQLDMESYLELHMGRVDGDEGDPWMEFQLKERMEIMEQGEEGQQSNKLSAMKHMYEEQLRKKNVNQKQNYNDNNSNNNHRPRPEEYCFYGVEGNPAFTRKLRGLELVLMNGGSSSSTTGDNTPRGELRGTASSVLPNHYRPHSASSAFPKGGSSISTSTSTTPRALRHIHFFTETVVTSSQYNGRPTNLYLDSVSEDHVGSSLLESHKYALMGGKTVVQVRGVTLTTLLNRALRGFGSNDDNGAATTTGTTGRDERGGGSGGHLILKIDIEGGEYSVLKEALESKLLCEYAARRGNRVDLAVEFHKWVIEDKKQKEEFAKLERRFYRELSTCGVHLTKMDIKWH